MTNGIDNAASFSFGLAVSHEPRRTILSLRGDIDPAQRELLTEMLRAALRTSPIVELDVSEVGMFGSAAIAAIVAARQGIDQPTLVVVNPAPHVARVLDITQLDLPIETRIADRTRPPASRPAYDQLIARAVTSGRESMCITTDDLDAPGPTIVYVNPAFCNLTGYEAHEVIGSSPRLLQGALTDRTMLDRLRRQLEEGETFHGETVNYRKDGTPFFMNWKISGVESSDGRYFVAHQSDASTSVRAVRNITATGLLTAASQRLGVDPVKQIAEALVAAHHVLLADGAIGVEIRRSKEPTEAAGDAVPDDPDKFERAASTGAVISETDHNGFELCLATETGDVDIRTIVSGLTDDHLKLASIDDLQSLIELAATLVARTRRS